MSRFPFTKAGGRGWVRLQLQRLSPEEVSASSADLVQQVRDHAYFKVARVIGLFHALAGAREPDLSALRESTDHEFAYPRVISGSSLMEFVKIGRQDSLTLQKVLLPHGKLIELVQPAPQLPALPPGALDLVLVPGVAFTADGRRLGRGGGFYDRYLATTGLRAKKLGIALPCQIVGALPLEAHDYPLDGVLIAAGA